MGWGDRPRLWVPCVLSHPWLGFGARGGRGSCTGPMQGQGVEAEAMFLCLRSLSGGRTVSRVFLGAGFSFLGMEGEGDASPESVPGRAVPASPGCSVSLTQLPTPQPLPSSDAGQGMPRRAGPAPGEPSPG